MRILLLTDIPPTPQLTAGLVLDRLCKFLPKGAVACFAVVNPEISVTLSGDLAGMPVHYVDKPRERGFSAGHRWSAPRRLAGWLYGLYHRHVATPRLIAKAARFGRAHDVDAVWVALQGQTLAHMAAPLAKRLDRPLITMVWDPLSWWLKANHVGPVSSRKAQRAFDAAIASSRAVATASWAMSRLYEQRYGAATTPVIASHDASIARSPAVQIDRADALVIGMAGQFYAIEEWRQVLVALNACKWLIAGREVFLKVAGHYVPPSDIPEGRVKVLGWLSHADVVAEMADCDVLYCPYPFDRDMEEVSRLSFPSKLTTYLAAGRPVLFHGPDWSSPGRYVADHGVGVVTAGVHASAVYNALHQLTTDVGLYQTSAANAAAAFRRDFTFATMRQSFFGVLGRAVAVDETAYAPVAPVDERKLRRTRSSEDSHTLRLLSFLPGIATVRTQVRELAEWKITHVQELEALYAHVRELNATIQEREALHRTLAAELSAASAREREDRLSLHVRDLVFARAMSEHDRAMRQAAIRIRSVLAESSGRIAAARGQLRRYEQEIAELKQNSDLPCADAQNANEKWGAK